MEFFNSMVCFSFLNGVSLRTDFLNVYHFNWSKLFECLLLVSIWFKKSLPVTPWSKRLYIKKNTDFYSYHKNLIHFVFVSRRGLRDVHNKDFQFHVKMSCVPCYVVCLSSVAARQHPPLLFLYPIISQVDFTDYHYSFFLCVCVCG